MQVISIFLVLGSIIIIWRKRTHIWENRYNRCTMYGSNRMILLYHQEQLNSAIPLVFSVSRCTSVTRKLTFSSLKWANKAVDIGYLRIQLKVFGSRFVDYEEVSPSADRGDDFFEVGGESVARCTDLGYSYKCSAFVRISSFKAG